MIFNRIQKQEAYKKLSTDVQDFIMSSETTELIENIINEAGLSTSEIKGIADSEILGVLLGLQTLDEAVKNLVQIEKNKLVDFSSLKSKLDNTIFSKLSKIKNTSLQETSVSPSTNSALKDAEVDKTSAEPIKSEPSVDNAATPSENKFEDRKSVVSVPNYSNYDSGKDPYREPIE